jgi:hypothetical protein
MAIDAPTLIWGPDAGGGVELRAASGAAAPPTAVVKGAFDEGPEFTFTLESRGWDNVAAWTYQGADLRPGIHELRVWMEDPVTGERSSIERIPCSVVASPSPSAPEETAATGDRPAPGAEYTIVVDGLPFTVPAQDLTKPWNPDDYETVVDDNQLPHFVPKGYAHSMGLPGYLPAEPAGVPAATAGGGVAAAPSKPKVKCDVCGEMRTFGEERCEHCGMETSETREQREQQETLRGLAAIGLEKGNSPGNTSTTSRN